MNKKPNMESCILFYNFRVITLIRFSVGSSAIQKNNRKNLVNKSKGLLGTFAAYQYDLNLYYL